MVNGVTPDNTKLEEGPMDKVTTMLPTVWFGAQSGRLDHLWGKSIRSSLHDFFACLREAEKVPIFCLIETVACGLKRKENTD